MIASWNGMTWECSPNQINRMDALSIQFEIETETSTSKDGETPTEVLGRKDIPITFSTTYRVETGTKDIKAVINKWRSLVGKTAPLIIGSEVFGPDKLQLNKVSVSNIAIRPNGVFTAATIAFSFVEWTGIKKKSKASSSAVSPNVKFDYAEFKSGLKVGASDEDKKSKNPVKMDATSGV